MHLGNYTCGVGDGKNNKTGKIERYISYWDIWDLDPFGNDSAYNINKFCFPFEIYGRIRESDINEIKN